MNKDCRHIDKIKKYTEASSRVCKRCKEKGTSWNTLRKCLVCGNVGCCDSSPEKHARKHFEETGHEIIEPLVDNPQWKWCFVDKFYL